MSLYNLIFGYNPLASLLLEALGIEASSVPRFRDCFLDTEGSEARICIYTRTGGGNRDFHENEARCRANYPEYFKDTDEPPTGPWNDDLTKFPGYLYDEDGDFDCTYANFYYSVPSEWKELIATLVETGAGAEKPSERWQKALAEMSSSAKTPEAERALQAGRQIFAKIAAAEVVP